MKLVLGLFGLENFYGGDVKSYIEIAQMGEELGFDAVSVTDHVVMGKNLHKYPFGQFPMPSDVLFPPSYRRFDHYKEYLNY